MECVPLCLFTSCFLILSQITEEEKKGKGRERESFLSYLGERERLWCCPPALVVCVCVCTVFSFFFSLCLLHRSPLNMLMSQLGSLPNTLGVCCPSPSLSGGPASSFPSFHYLCLLLSPTFLSNLIWKETR